MCLTDVTCANVGAVETAAVCTGVEAYLSGLDGGKQITRQIVADFPRAESNLGQRKGYGYHYDYVVTSRPVTQIQTPYTMLKKQSSNRINEILQPRLSLLIRSHHLAHFPSPAFPMANLHRMGNVVPSRFHPPAIRFSPMPVAQAFTRTYVLGVEWTERAIRKVLGD